MNHELLIDNYLSGPKLIRDAIQGMSQKQLLARPIEGQWSTHEVICHLADCETLYADRIKRVLAESNPVLPSLDPDNYVPRLSVASREVEDELALIEVVRRQMGRILRTLVEADWDRTGNHTTDGPLTVTALLTRIESHIPHHVHFIREKRKAL